MIEILIISVFLMMPLISLALDSKIEDLKRKIKELEESRK